MEAEAEAEGEGSEVGLYKIGSASEGLGFIAGTADGLRVGRFDGNSEGALWASRNV